MTIGKEKFVLERVVPKERDGEAMPITTFEELYTNYRKKLVHHLFHLVGHLDTAVDLSQEAFLRAHNEKKLWESEDSLPVAWLFRVAGNLAKNHLRDEGRAAKRTPISDKEPISPYEVLVRRQDRAGLLRALEELSPIQRQCLSLRYFSRWSCKEVAKALEIPEGTVVSHIYRARCQLRRLLK